MKYEYKVGDIVKITNPLYCHDSELYKRTINRIAKIIKILDDPAFNYPYEVVYIDGLSQLEDSDRIFKSSEIKKILPEEAMLEML